MSAGGEETTGYRSSLPWRLYNGASQLIDRKVGLVSGSRCRSGSPP